MDHPIISTPSQLQAFCQRLSHADLIGLDTEFVSEDSYRPQLCLVQISIGDTLAAIDALKIPDLTPFWRLLAEENRETVVHSGREELGFCLTAIDQRPARLFDTQIAAGLVGSEYPAGYGSLVSKYLGQKPDKGETRTDWRRRPLSDEQVRYALEDVRYLLPLRGKLFDLLEDKDRLEWLETETSSWQDEVERARSRQRWRKVTGISGLSGRSLAIVRELWLWRDQRARESDLPPRRVLRDDLIVEIAKRKSSSVNRIKAIRGIERGRVGRAIPELAECARRALALPDGDLPQKLRREQPPQLSLLSQFLAAALNSICQNAGVATSIVGTSSDIRDLVAYRLGLVDPAVEPPPSLKTGWRAEVVGQTIDDLLSGKTCIRIQDPASKQPLAFESVANDE